MFTKTQLFTAAAVAASASTVLAAPAFDSSDLQVRGGAISKEIKETIAKAATSRTGRKIAQEVGKNVYTKVGGNALEEQKKKDAAKHKNQHNSHGRRDLDQFELEAREFDDFEDLFARGGAISKEIKETIAKAATSRTGRKIAQEVGKNVYTKVGGNALEEQKKKDAAKHKNQHNSHGRRDVDEFEFEAREFDDLEDLYARGGAISKEIKETIAKAATSRTGRKIAQEVGKNVYTKVGGNALEEQKKKDAAKHKNQHNSHGRRDLDEFEFEARDYDDFEDLFARGGAISKEIKETIAKAATSRTGRKIAQEVGKNVYTKVGGNALEEQKKKDAAKHKNQHNSHGRRDLDEFEFEVRDFEDLEDLFTRGGAISKEIKETIAKAATSRTGRKVAQEVGKNVYTKVGGNALEEQKKKDAAKHKNQHNSHGRRDLNEFEFDSREFDELEDLYARGGAISKEIKETIAKAATSRTGRKIAQEVGKNVYTKVGGNALEEQKEKDAAKHKNQHNSHGRRDLELDLYDLITRELEFYDELD